MRIVGTSPAWRKSTRCGGSATCVEVGPATTHDLIGLRDSADPDGPILALTPADWHTLLNKIKEIP